MREATTYKKPKSLLRSTTLVSTMTFSSRMLGFVRDVVLAVVFGAGIQMDAFSIAFKIPNFMRRLFAEGAFSQAFVPILSEYQSKQPEPMAKAFIGKVMGTLAFVLLLVTLLAVLFSPWLVGLFAPGFLQAEDPTRYHLASEMLRLTFPYLLFISLTAFYGAVLNTYGHYGLPAFTPVLLNVVLIFSALYLTDLVTIPIIALAWGVLLAGIVQFLFQIPYLYLHKLWVKPSIAFHDPGVLRVMKGMVPALFGVSVAQLNLLVDTVFASFLTAGSVSWLYYADRLMNFPLGVFGVALATVILPQLSRSFATQKPHAYAETVNWAMKSIFVISLPAASALLWLSGPIVITLFFHGAFNSHDAHMTEYCLQAFALGVPAFMGTKVLASAFYAQQDMNTPVRVGVVAMVVNIILNCLLIWHLAHVGLALATSLSAYVNMLLLWRRFKTTPMYVAKGRSWRFLTCLSVGNILMMLVCLFLGMDSDHWFEIQSYTRVLDLSLMVMACVAGYTLYGFLCGLRPRDCYGPKLNISEGD